MDGDLAWAVGVLKNGKPVEMVAYIDSEVGKPKLI